MFLIKSIKGIGDCEIFLIINYIKYFIFYFCLKVFFSVFLYFIFYRGSIYISFWNPKLSFLFIYSNFSLFFYYFIAFYFSYKKYFYCIFPLLIGIIPGFSYSNRFNCSGISKSSLRLVRIYFITICLIYIKSLYILFSNSISNFLSLSIVLR